MKSEMTEKQLKNATQQMKVQEVKNFLSGTFFKELRLLLCNFMTLSLCIRYLIFKF